MTTVFHAGAIEGVRDVQRFVELLIQNSHNSHSIGLLTVIQDRCHDLIAEHQYWIALEDIVLLPGEPRIQS
jgi:hypothetical protein